MLGKKCAVGGQDRGIISSASYEARACGVYTPMPTQRAKAVCPDLILIPHTSGLYGQMSRRMFDLCETLTPEVQRNSIDEGYLDLKSCGFRDAIEVETAVRGLQRRLQEELRLPVSFGLATNKLVAQIASKLRKPRGFVVVPPGEGDVPRSAVDRETARDRCEAEAMLVAQGVVHVRDILTRTPEDLRVLFGQDWREGMVERARGIDERPSKPSGRTPRVIRSRRRLAGTSPISPRSSG